METMPKITASLSRRVDARGKSEILLRFVGGRDHIYRLHSRLSVQPARWKDGAVIIPRLGTAEQRELIQLRDKLANLVRFLLDEFQSSDQACVTGEWMQDAVDRFHHPDRAGRRDFFDLYDEFCRTQDVSTDRRKRYKVVRGYLEDFQEDRKKKLTIEGTDAGVLDSFRAFMAKGGKGKNIIIDYMKVVRAFYHWMNGRGLCSADPFRGYQIGTAVYGTPYYLTLEERDRLYRTRLHNHPSLAVQRDIFVFQCVIGCRVSDLRNLTKDSVIDGAIEYIPRKTKEGRPYTVRVPLNAVARAILEKYKDTPGKALLPCISDQNYNYAIKDVFTACGLTRMVTVLNPTTRQEEKRPLNEVASSHLARRCFIGNLYKQVKDPNLIGKLSGHVEGSKAFSRYRDIDEDMRKDLVKLLEG